MPFGMILSTSLILEALVGYIVCCGFKCFICAAMPEASKVELRGIIYYCSSIYIIECFKV